MKTFIAIISLTSIQAFAWTTTYTQVGDTTYGSNGSTYTQVGNTTYGSDGSIANRVGNTTYETTPTMPKINPYTQSTTNNEWQRRNNFNRGY
jgi:hypothetical protein